MGTIRRARVAPAMLALVMMPLAGGSASAHLAVGGVFAPPGSPDPIPTEEPFAPPAEDHRPTGADEPDPVAEGRYTHVIYFVPRDKPDEDLDRLGGPIRRSVDSMLAWFAQQMERRPRMDRLGTGEYDVTYVRGQENAASYSTLAAISDELIARQLTTSSKRYVVYAAVDRGTVCGEGFYPHPEPLNEGQFSAVYLDSSSGCGSRDFGGGTAGTAGKTETIVAHEWMHNDGIVPLGAPHQCIPLMWHVCTGPLAYVPGLDPEEADVAFPFVTHRLRFKKLDVGRDDYLDHDLPVTDLRDSPWLEPA